jgi:transmembrane sensor
VSELPQARPLADIEADAAAWVRRRHFWDWSEEDRAALDAWLAQSISHRVAYWRMESGFARAEKLVALRDPKTEAVKSERRFPVMIGIAAALALIALVGAGAMNYVLRPHDRIYSTPVGGHEKIVFADGTRVELNTDTVLRARMNTAQRIVWLEKGEAYFQVKHDAAHPFTVMVGERRVTDLGTAFLVRRDESRMELAVVQGKVRFDAGAARPASTLTQGDVVTASGSTVSEAKKPESALENELGWRRGVLVFDNTTLAIAAEEFNRYNRQKIVITDPAAARLAMVGTFPIHDVSAFTDAAEDIFKLRVENRGSEIVISR